MAKAKRLKEYEAWSRSIQGQEIPNLVAGAKFLGGPVGNLDLPIADDKPTFRYLTSIDLPNSVFYFDNGFVYNNDTAGFEYLKIGSHGIRFLTIAGRGSGDSSICANRGLDIESTIGNPITIGDASANHYGTKIAIEQINIAITASTEVSIDCPTVIISQGYFALGDAAIIQAPTATAKSIQSTIPAGTGVTPTIQIICPSAAVTLTSGTSTQAVFSSSANTITLQAATTYMFEGQYLLGTGTVVHTTAMSFVLTTATMTNCTWTTFTTSPSALNTPAPALSTAIFNSVTGGACNGGSGNPNTIIKFTGIMRVNAAGTCVPNIQFGTAPGGTCQTLVGSYLRFYPIGANTIDSVGTAIG